MFFVALCVVAFFLQAFFLKRVWPKPIQNVNNVLMWILIIFTSAGAFPINVFLFFTLRFVSQSLYVRYSCWMQSTYLQIFIMMIHNYMECRLKVYGEGIDKNDTHLWISNHVTHDWMAVYPTKYFFGATGNERVVIKNSVAHIPFLGWTMTMFYWPFLARDFAKDVKVLQKCFNAYRAAKIGLQVWLFPEGTRPSPSKVAESQKHARETGKPVWDNVMLPRHRGFCAAVDALKGVATHLVDTTIAYDGFKDNRRAPLSEIILWDHSKVHTVHVHIHKVPLASIPQEEAGRKEWLMNCFQAKEDRLGEYWKSNGAGFDGKLIGDVDMKTLDWVAFTKGMIMIFAMWTVNSICASAIASGVSAVWGMMF